MHSRRSHASLGAVVMLALVLGWSKVAWSPVVGSGFAGVALAGTLR